MDYFCSENALPCMRNLTPDDLDEMIFSEYVPDGHIFITDNFSGSYLLTKSDMLPTSRMIVYNNPHIIIEYFENGIPTWLDPVPGLRIYEADWTGDRWEFTKVSGI